MASIWAHYRQAWAFVVLTGSLAVVVALAGSFT